MPNNIDNTSIANAIVTDSQARVNAEAQANEAYEKELMQIIRQQGNIVKNVTRAIVTAINGVFNRKSCERLNQLARILSGDKMLYARIKPALIFAAGGYDEEIIADKVKRFRNDNASLIQWDTKQKLFALCATTEKAFTEKKRVWDNRLSQVSYLELKGATRSNDYLFLEALAKFADQAGKHKDSIKGATESNAYKAFQVFMDSIAE